MIEKLVTGSPKAKRIEYRPKTRSNGGSIRSGRNKTRFACDRTRGNFTCITTA